MRNRRLLFITLALTLVMMTVEIVAGVAANSLALLADAGHMLTDVIAVGLAAKPPRGRWPYGFDRVEIFAAQLNGVILGLLGVLVVYEAAKLLIDPLEANATLVG